MITSINEQIVIDFYVELINKDKIEFLKDSPLKPKIKKTLKDLRKSPDLNTRINNAKELWKKLFEASMSFIDDNKCGYDKLFRYFDEYVKFEELIFASDSFYRDHTLHSIWVYLLGEYLVRADNFSHYFVEFEHFFDNCDNIESFLKMLNDERSAKRFHEIGENRRMQDSMRCVAALTHDLGYPLRKIEKINESIKRILPYFSINRFDDCYFNFEALHQSFIMCFLDALSTNIKVSIGDEDSEDIITKIFEYKEIDKKFILKKIKNEIVDILSEEEKEKVRKSIGPKIIIESSTEKRLRYSFDLEQYEHGIMSALLLVKTVDSFRKFSLSNFNNRETHDANYAFDPKHEILSAISDHTSKGFQIKGLHNLSEYLILIDEIEEFSRISRANQNREFISEFCKTNIGFEDGYFEVEFSFDKSIITVINTERYFKDKSTKLIHIFNLKKLNTSVKFRMICLDKNNGEIENRYVVEIERNQVKIIINGEQQNIFDYLQSHDF